MCSRASLAYRSRCIAPVPYLKGQAQLLQLFSAFRCADFGTTVVEASLHRVLFCFRHQDASKEDAVGIAEAFVSPAQAGPEVPQI